MSALVNQSSGYLNAGAVPQPQGNAHPSIAPHEPLPTQDRPLVVAVGNDRQFAALCDELGVPALAVDPRLATNAARVAHRDTLLGLLSDALAAAPASEWSERLARRGVPAGPVNRVDEAFALAAHLGLDPVVEMRNEPHAAWSRQVRNPVDFAATPVTYRHPPPRWEHVLTPEEALALLHRPA